MQNDFPTPEAMGPWRPSNDAGTQWPLARLVEVAFAGTAPVLYLTHPQQLLKLYHQYDVSHYRSWALDARDETCALCQLTRMRDALTPAHHRQGTRTGSEDSVRQGRLRLSHAAFGHLRRRPRQPLPRRRATGVLKSHESMGHSVAPGHTVYERSGSGYSRGAVDAYDGDTYPVPVADFVMLARLLPSDLGKIARYRDKALQTHRPHRLVWRCTENRDGPRTPGCVDAATRGAQLPGIYDAPKPEYRTPESRAMS